MIATLLFDASIRTQADGESMAVFLERTQTEYGLPSICAGAIVEGHIVVLDAVGVRHLGSDEKATTDDPYH